MNAWFGALLGLGLALGALTTIFGLPKLRAVRLSDRISPYLTEVVAPSGLMASAGSGTRSQSLRALFGPGLRAAVRWLDRLIGGSESVRRRLGGLGSATTVEEFRVEQVLWGSLGLIAGALGMIIVTALRGGVDPVLSVGAALIGGVTGVLGRDWLLSRELRQREQAMLAEFPVIADLMALSVVAGESPIDALQRVCRLTRGELTRDLSVVLAEARAGTPITKALSALADRSTMEAFSRFAHGLVVAIERGTPLAGVLHAQATDVRESAKRALLEAGGQKELQMMVPVVFLILPVTVLFALYPGLLALVSLAK